MPQDNHWNTEAFTTKVHKPLVLKLKKPLQGEHDFNQILHVVRWQSWWDAWGSEYDWPNHK